MPCVYVCEYSFKQTGALLDHFKQEKYVEGESDGHYRYAGKQWIKWEFENKNAIIQGKP